MQPEHKNFWHHEHLTNAYLQQSHFSVFTSAMNLACFKLWKTSVMLSVWQHTTHTWPYFCKCLLVMVVTWQHHNQELLPVTLIDYDGVRLTSQNRSLHWPVVHPVGESEWRAMVMMMQAGDMTVCQSSLAVLPAETSGASIRNGRRNENFAYSVSLRHQRIFYMP
jgi:hypothetical protein